MDSKEFGDRFFASISHLRPTHVDGDTAGFDVLKTPMPPIVRVEFGTEYMVLVPAQERGDVTVEYSRKPGKTEEVKLSPEELLGMLDHSSTHSELLAKFAGAEQT